MICKNCGASVDDSAILCPSCGASPRVKKESAPSSKKIRNKKSSKKQNNYDGYSSDSYDSYGSYDDYGSSYSTKKEFPIKMVLLIAGAGVVAAALIGVIVAGVLYIKDSGDNNASSTFMADGSNNPNSNNSGSNTPGGNGRPDADQYYHNSGTLVSEILATDSTNVKQENNVTGTVGSRGFNEYPISYEYSITGEYLGETDIDAASDSSHPIYQTYYHSANDEYWTIYVIDGVVMAYPISYNMQSNKKCEVIFSESDAVTAYDSVTNKFYTFVPYDTVLDVKTVGHIDAATLDSLTVGAIDNL